MDFELFFDQICQQLKQNDCVQENSEKFAKLSTDQSRINFVLQMKELESPLLELFVKLKETCPTKSADSAIKSRITGNNFFQKKDNLNALKCYNKSIIYSPYQEGQELALAFANRSAVLFDYQKWWLCLRDIYLSLDHGYPQKLHYKLYERMGHCWKHLGNTQKARESYLRAKETLSYAGLDSSKAFRINSNLDSLLESNPIIALTDEDYSKEIELIETLMNSQRRTAPMLNGNINPKLPCATDAVHIDCSVERGRHLVATADIEPGTTIIVEPAFTAVLLSERQESHCHNCLHPTVTPVPCNQCSEVQFCSIKCKSKAWASYHHIECGFHMVLQRANLGNNAILATRTLTSFPSDTLISMVESPKEFMIGTDVYDSSDYTTIYNLITNTSQRSIADLFRRTVMAVFIVKFLEQCRYFDDLNQLPVIACVLLKHLQNYPCNAHEISQICSSSEDLGQQKEKVSKSPLDLMEDLASATAIEARLTEIGAAAFSALSLINHSCDPNVSRYCYGSVAVVTTIQKIYKGQEILDNYGYHYALHPLEERQQKLRNQYYFNCACVACINKWPLYEASASQMKIRCPNNECSSSCPTCRDIQNKLKQSADVFYEDLDKFMQLSCHDRQTCRLLATKFSKHIALMDSCVIKPFRQYNDIQEALKQCLALDGSVFLEI